MAERIVLQEDKEKAERLKKLFDKKKKELGLTQVTSAQKLGITQSAISQFLNAIVPLNTDTILKFAEILEVKPSEIDKSLSEDRFRSKEIFQPIPIIGTMSNRQPTEYYKKLWLKKPDHHAIGFEVDEETVDYPKNSFLILTLNKKPSKNSSVLIRLRKRNRFQTGKYLGTNNELLQFDFGGTLQELTANEISYFAKINEVVRP